MIENEMSVAVPALAAGAVAFVFIAFLYTKLAKFETGTDIGVPVLDELSLQVGPPTPNHPTHPRLSPSLSSVPCQDSSGVQERGVCLLVCCLTSPLMAWHCPHGSCRQPRQGHNRFVTCTRGLRTSG